MKKEKLNQFTLDIEFLLISVIQGVALGTLSAYSSQLLANLLFETWLYIFSALLIILIFWSEAMIHALSFVRWPLDLGHNFLYILASFIEFIAFNHLTSPKLWFVFISIFAVIGEILYIYDYFLIRKHKGDFNTEAEIKLYNYILKSHLFDLKIFSPILVLFNLLSLFLISTYPEKFIAGNYHITLISLQVIGVLIYLANSVKNFKRRSKLISESV